MITALKGNTSVTWLDLRGNQITDAGAIKLAEILPSSKLTFLDLDLTILGLDGNKITDAGKAALKDIKNKDGKKIEIR